MTTDMEKAREFASIVGEEEAAKFLKEAAYREKSAKAAGISFKEKGIMEFEEFFAEAYEAWKSLSSHEESLSSDDQLLTDMNLDGALTEKESDSARRLMEMMRHAMREVMGMEEREMKRMGEEMREMKRMIKAMHEGMRRDGKIMGGMDEEAEYNDIGPDFERLVMGMKSLEENQKKIVGALQQQGEAINEYTDSYVAPVGGGYRPSDTGLSFEEQDELHQAERQKIAQKQQNGEYSFENFASRFSNGTVNNGY